MKSKLKSVYENKYKLLLIIPLLLLVLAILQIGVQTAVTGDFVNKGITLKGGSTITIEDGTINIIELEQFLNEKFPGADISIRTITSAGSVTGIAIDSDAQETKEIDNLVNVIEKKTDLSSISIRMPEENSSTPGLYYFIFQRLAWEGIVIWEVISTSNEFTILVSENQIDVAFKVIKDLKNLIGDVEFQ